MLKVLFRYSLVVLVALMATGCATTTGQYALDTYCEMSEDEREVVRERIQERCDAQE